MTLRKCLAFFLILQLVLHLVSTTQTGLCGKSAREHPWDEVKDNRPIISSVKTNITF
jgi:hypothetical protein